MRLPAISTAFCLSLLLLAAPAHAQSVFEMATSVVQTTLGSMTRDIYIDFVHGLQRPIQIFLTIFVMCYGILFATGIVKHSTGEFAKVMFKIAFVFAFALDSTGWAADFIQGFFMGIVNTGSSLVLSGVTGNPFRNAVHGGGGDGLALAALNLATGIGGCGILSFLALLLFAFAPLFGLFSLFLLTFAYAFISAIFGFVTSIVMIAILSAFAPFFVPLALFKFSSKAFEQWLKMLVANSIQVILVFAFIGFVVRINPFSVLTSLGEVVVPYQPISFFGFGSWGPPLCTVCEYTVVGGAPTCNMPISPIPIMDLPLHPEFYGWALTGLFSIVALGWALLQIFREVPSLSKSLSGAFYMGMGGGLMAMGGGAFGGSTGGIGMPGDQRWAAAIQAASQQVGQNSRSMQNQLGMSQLRNRIGLSNPFLSDEARQRREERGLELDRRQEEFNQSTQIGRATRAFVDTMRYGAMGGQQTSTSIHAQRQLVLLEQQQEEEMLRLEEAARESKEREAEEYRLRRQLQEQEQAETTGTELARLENEAQQVALMKTQLAAAEARQAEKAAREKLKEIKRARAVYERAARGLGRDQVDALKGISRNEMGHEVGKRHHWLRQERDDHAQLHLKPKQHDND